jgi:hypothetical protein
MKIVFFLLFIAVSTTANAKSNIATLQFMEPEQNSFLKKIIASTEVSEPEFHKNEANNLELWKSLDTNKNNLISKAEIAYAKNIIESWDMLDSNKDGKIDFFEFSRVPVKFL